MHAGHTSRVSDISWNTNDDWTLASVAEDNVLQIWRMVCLHFSVCVRSCLCVCLSGGTGLIAFPVQAEHVYTGGGSGEPADVELE